MPDKVSQLSSLAKNFGDGTSLAAVLAVLIDAVTPVMKIVMMILSAAWLFVRIWDMILAIKLKKKELNKK